MASRPFHSSLAQSSQLQQLAPQHHHIAPSRAPPSLRKVFDGIELPTLNDIRADERGKREDTNALLKTGSTLNGRLGFTKPRTIYSAGKSYSNEASTRAVSSDSLTRYAGTLRSVTPTNVDGQTFDHKNSHLDASRVLEGAFYPLYIAIVPSLLATQTALPQNTSVHLPFNKDLLRRFPPPFRLMISHPAHHFRPTKHTNAIFAVLPDQRITEPSSVSNPIKTS